MYISMHSTAPVIGRLELPETSRLALLSRLQLGRECAEADRSIRMIFLNTFVPRDSMIGHPRNRPQPLRKNCSSIVFRDEQLSIEGHIIRAAPPELKASTMFLVPARKLDCSSRVYGGGKPRAMCLTELIAELSSTVSTPHTVRIKEKSA